MRLGLAVRVRVRVRARWCVPLNLGEHLCVSLCQVLQGLLDSVSRPLLVPFLYRSTGGGHRSPASTGGDGGGGGGGGVGYESD